MTKPSPMINQQFTLSGADVDYYKQHGFVLLKQLFTPDGIQVLSDITNHQIAPPTDNYGAGFSKLQYDVGNADARLLEAVSDPVFSSAISGPVGEDLFFTQGLGFELEKNVSSGFPWHVGTQSFGFQRLEDIGVTLWTPLCEITPASQGGQGGGMAYLSREHLSGEFVYQHIQLVPTFLKQAAEYRDSDFTTFSNLKNSLLNSDTMRPLLDHFATEDSFAPGDALLFDKWVMHRSEPLREGPISVRQAFAWRFSSTQARYDQQRVADLAYPRTKYNYDVGSPFNDIVATADGDVVYDSEHFSADREKRTLRHK